MDIINFVIIPAFLNVMYVTGKIFFRESPPSFFFIPSFHMMGTPGVHGRLFRKIVQGLPICILKILHEIFDAHVSHDGIVGDQDIFPEFAAVPGCELCCMGTILICCPCLFLDI